MTLSIVDKETLVTINSIFLTEIYQYIYMEVLRLVFLYAKQGFDTNHIKHAALPNHYLISLTLLLK